MVGLSKRVTNIWFSEDDRYLYLTGWDGELVSWDLAEKKKVGSAAFPLVDSQASWVYSARTDPNRSVMVAATNPGRLVAYSLPELEPIWDEAKQLGWWTVDAITVSDDAKWVAAGAVAGEIRLWHIPSGVEVPCVFI